MKKKNKKDTKKGKKKVRKPRKKSSLKKVKKLEDGGDISSSVDTDVPIAYPVQTVDSHASVPASQPVQVQPTSAPQSAPQPMSIDVQIMDEANMHVKGEIPVERLVVILGRKPKERELINGIIIRKCFLRPFWKIEK